MELRSVLLPIEEPPPWGSCKWLYCPSPDQPLRCTRPWAQGDSGPRPPVAIVPRAWAKGAIALSTIAFHLPLEDFVHGAAILVSHTLQQLTLSRCALLCISSRLDRILLFRARFPSEEARRQSGSR
jgi:hypothetical protein